MTKKEINFSLAAKAFIIQNNKLLILKRSENDVQKPNIWEIPGGRLDHGEDPILGLMREVREETGLYVTPKQPLSVRHFQRDDGQTITLLIFLCKPHGGTFQISEEHSDHEWIELDSCKEKLSEYFHKEVDIYRELNLHNLIDF